MTLDEAIKHCEEVAEEQDKLCKRYDDASGYSRSHNEAIRTADAGRCEECAKEHRQLAEWLKELKALREQEPCEDCISRQAAKKIIFEEFEGWPTDEEVVRLKRLTRQFDELPSVTPARARGEWMMQGDINHKLYGWYYCSVCGAYIGVKTNFCSECSADMRGDINADSD